MRCVLFLIAVLSLALTLPASVGRAGDGVFVLRTEKVELRSDAISGRLVRELARQALLLTARDGLGYATRDATLGEPDHLGETPVAADWLPTVATQWTAPTTVSLRAAGGEELEPIRLEPGKLNRNSIYPKLATAWEQASRGFLHERMLREGLGGEVPPPNPDNCPNEEVEALLGQANFISQWDAVARAHRAIAEEGPSVEWLAVLVRGYAHLGSLTDHHWTGAPEAFYARSLLYAERARFLAAEGPKASWAKWLKPYALAVCGAHGAVRDWEKDAIEATPEAPDWARLIEPIIRFDTPKLIEIGEADGPHSALARWLVVSLRRTLGSHRSFHDVALACLEESPDAFGVYNDLVRVYPSLGDQRYGAFRGPVSLGIHPLLRVARVEGIPPKLRDSLPADEESLAPFIEKLEASLPGEPSPPFSAAPTFLAKLFRRLDAGAKSPPEPSWGSLASLLEEEQFVMASNYCQSLLNATETPIEDQVAGVERVVGTHRYAPYIASYRLKGDATDEQRSRVWEGLEFHELRHNMWPMFSRAFKLPSEEGSRLTKGHRGSWSALWSPDYRLASLAEEYLHGGGYWWTRLDNKQKWGIRRDYRYVAPDSPHWLRIEMGYYHAATPKLLAKWEKSADRDAVTASRQASFYEQAGEKEKALAWYEIAHELEPSPDSAINVAHLYRETGREDRWLPTLTTYLRENESRGLEHASVHQYIARTYMSERDYAAAISHAELAAEGYSTPGLAVAFEAAEGLADWEAADHYARALSTSYPTARGEKWYFFRRRTGYGDPEEALPFLARSFRADRRNSNVWDKASLPYFEGDLATTIDLLQGLGKSQQDPVYSYLMAVVISLELGDATRTGSALDALREHTDNEAFKEKDPPLHENVMRCLSLLESKELLTERDALLQGIDRLTPNVRRNFQFFFGALLHHLEIEDDLATELLERAVSTPEFHHMSGNIAGHLLVKKRGYAREDPIQPPPRAEGDKAETEEEEGDG